MEEICKDDDNLRLIANIINHYPVPKGDFPI